MAIPLEATDLMPFGKYGPKNGDHRTMEEVPASYLLWLYDNDEGLWQDSTPWKQGVKKYVEENLSVLLSEHRDYIMKHEPKKSR